jgi:hypothetical protein
MSQFGIRNIREISNDPLTKFTNQIAKKLSLFLNKQQTDKLENKEDIFSAAEDIETVIRLHNFTSTKQFLFDTQYFAPIEPNDTTLRVWLRGTNMGNQLRDWSVTPEKVANMFGDPLLIDGTPLDLGIHTSGVKSTCLSFNRATSELASQEYIEVIDTVTQRIQATTTGKSWFLRFRMRDLDSQGGLAVTLLEKIDDDIPDDGIQICVTSDGRLRAFIKRLGSEHNKETAAGTIALNTIYDVWVTYTISGGVTHVYVNGVDKTLSTSGDSLSWHGDETYHDTSIFRRGPNHDGSLGGGFVNGDFYEYRHMDEYVVSSTEVTQHYANKWTIANIPFGQVAISDYAATYLVITASYTTTSFTSTSFDI